MTDPKECNCYIRPEVEQYSSWSFTDAIKILEAGKTATEIVIPKLKKDLHLN